MCCEFRWGSSSMLVLTQQETLRSTADILIMMMHAHDVLSVAEGRLEQKVASPEVARGVYSQRESFLAKREAEGELTFKYVENDGAPDNSMWCACLARSHSLQGSRRRSCCGGCLCSNLAACKSCLQTPAGCHMRNAL